MDSSPPLRFQSLEYQVAPGSAFVGFTPYPQKGKLNQANSRVFLPKLGWLRYRNSRDVLGAGSNVTVLANGGKWFVSIQTQGIAC